MVVDTIGSGKTDIWLVHSDSMDKPRPFLAQATIVPGARLQVARRDTLFLSAGRFRTGSPSFDVLPGDREFIMLSSGAGDQGNIFPLMVMTNWHKSRNVRQPSR